LLPRENAFIAVGALGFRGRWEEPFDPKATRQPFVRADGTRISVPMMHKADTFDYAEDAQAQTIAVPFVGARVELRLVLPQQGQALPADKRKAAAWLNAARDQVLESRPGALRCRG
jgi:serpin B